MSQEHPSGASLLCVILKYRLQKTNNKKSEKLNIFPKGINISVPKFTLFLYLVRKFPLWTLVITDHFNYIDRAASSAF